MELMFLVYAVENLTYNGSFFLTVASLLFTFSVLIGVLKLGVNFYNQNNKELRTITQPKVKLKEKDVFVLDKDVYEFKAGTEYVVSSVFKHCDDLYYKKLGSSRLESVKAKSHIEELLSKQQREITKTQEAKSFKLPAFPVKTTIGVMLLALLLHTFLPTRQTAIYMASAYAIQKVATAEQTKELANKGYSALSSQLTKWAEEVPEVADMLVDAGLNTVKKEISK